VPLAFLAFVSLGLPDGVLGVAWPSLRRSFLQPIDRLGLILLTMTAGYLASSFGAGALVRRLGVGRLLLGSGLLVAASASLWAVTPVFALIVAGGLLAGTGAGAIDAGINAFAATHFTPRTITWLHACWGLGAMAGPLAMTATLAAGLGWRVGYSELATALVLLSLCFGLTLGQWDTPPSGASSSRAENDAAARAQLGAPSLAEALGDSRVRANALLFFVYTGIEAGAGQWSCTFLTESRGMGAAAAGFATSCYWGSIFAGRIAFGAAAHHVSPRVLLRLVTCAAPIAALAVSATRSGLGGVAGLCGLGLMLAPVFPLLIAETPGRVGERHSAHAIGFQVAAATLGSGALPSLAGVLLRRIGLEMLGPFLLAATLTLLALHERAARSGERSPAPTPRGRTAAE
jgi:fucose permease